MVINDVPLVRAHLAGQAGRATWLKAVCESQLLFVLLSARRHRMPARETEAIILKTFPLGEADRLVSFLGRSSGRMRGVAAGARRIKSCYGAAAAILFDFT